MYLTPRNQPSVRKLGTEVRLELRTLALLVFIEFKKRLTKYPSADHPE